MKDSLHTITDTIHQKVIVIDTLRMSSKDSMDMLSKMDSFYNNAWTKLILVVTIAFAVIGILVPLLVQWYQRKELRINEESLKKDITSELETALKQLRIDFEKINSENLGNLKTETYATIYQVQGVVLNSQGLYEHAVRSFYRAIDNYIKVKNNENSNNILNSLFPAIKANLKLCKKDTLNIQFSRSQITFIEALKNLSDADKENTYKYEIAELKKIYDSLPDSINPSAPQPDGHPNP